MSRTRAYKRLAAAMGLTPETCHMKQMTAEQARKVPAIANQMLKEINP